MQAATKVVFNTIILYIKVLASMAIALVSVPLVLKALGTSDYGLYNLVAGVVAMLSFLNASLTVSSQRYMSVTMGSGDVEGMNMVYNTSFLLHLILGIIVVTLLEIGVLFIGRLNIPSGRMRCAELVYQFLVFSTFSKILSVPFDALINAHEDLLAFSIIELIDSILMFVVAVMLQFISLDRLAFYGFSVAIIALLTVVMKYIWVKKKYSKFHINLLQYYRGMRIKSMFSYAGWNLFGGLALMGRNQGVAIVINIFQGTIANAAYGIANQINGAVSQFSGTLQRAINPQLMKSEGMNDRTRMLRLSYISSKFSTLALCLFTVPLIVEMPDVLQIWLHGNIPPYTIELSRCILILTVVYQLSVGIMSAIQAAGNIRNYHIAVGSLILLNVPITYFLLKNGCPIYYATLWFIIIEIISLCVRLFMARRLVGMETSSFLVKVLFPVVCILFIPTMMCLVPYFYVHDIFHRLILTSLVYGLTYLSMVWMIGLDKAQKIKVINKIFHR